MAHIFEVAQANSQCPAEKSEKQVWRSTYSARRNARSAELRAMRDHALCEGILSSPLFRDANALLVYSPIRSEINIEEIVSYAFAHNIPVAYPLTHGASCMTFHTIRNAQELILGNFGLKEPSATAPLLCPTANTLMLVPALCYDQHGFRVGYGGGYYDRYLSTFPGISVGLVYREDIAELLPRLSHDRAVNYLATEHGILPTREFL